MISYETTQHAPYEVVIILRDAAGAPLTGLLSTDVTLLLRKPYGTFVPKALGNTNFFELDDTRAPGYYGIRLSAEDTDTVGNLVLHIPANGGAGLARADVTVCVQHLESGFGVCCYAI